MFCFRCDELEIKINYLLGENLFVGRAASFIYRDEGLEIKKSFLKYMDLLDAFDLQNEYRIGEAFFDGCWLCFALSDKWTKMRIGLINKLDIIIIYLDYLREMEMHANVWLFI